ncbi:hypothetical protein SLE2022_166710 [Rubroshorea leprosula]
MECNKEEAIRAKEIAEKRMMNKDFHGALKIGLKAQQLYHDLENISQMLMACEVHCAAEKKIFGNEMDWYDILKIEQTADEATIKKQYRKFALLLHPDKNKFPGAEAAFKLIGEAQRVLLDQSKRSAYDMKHRVTLGKPAPTAAARQPQRSSWNPHVTAQTKFRTNLPGSIRQQKQPQQQSQQAHSNGRPTFWTKCPFCTVKYQYYTDILHRTLRCQTCDKSFIAYNLGAAPQATDASQPKAPQQKDVQNQGAQNVKQGFHANLRTENSKAASSSKAAHDSRVGTGNANDKRGRKRPLECCESCHTESSSGSEDDILIDERSNVQAGKDVKCPRENLRRSVRHKQEVSYRENLSDDEDLVNPPKRAKGSSSSNATEEDGDTPKEETHEINNLANGKKEAKKVFGQETTKEGDPKKCSEACADGGKMNFNADSKSNLSPQSSQEPDIYLYPDPDFNDFDKDRKEAGFAVGQIWAAYDTLDAMPRFYVRIRKVFSPGFKLRITWLEPDPDDVNEIKWVDEGLPVSCGKFRYGNSENTENRLMFSHLMRCDNGARRDTFKVFPRKGETWALFKNWDIKWNSDAGSNRKFEYQFVEILSEYDDGAGILVACLVKVKGFVSLFCRMVEDGIDAFQIPPSKLFRFSHRVPSFKLTGMERQGVPKGSFELDPASLATNLEEIVVPKELHSRSPGKVKRKMGSEKIAPVNHDEVKQTDPDLESYSANNATEDHSSSSASSPEIIEYPDPEFYSFDDEKSQEKFRVGQIWSLYCDEDGLPKYYGQIIKIESNPVFKLYVRWLCACPSQEMIHWHDKDMLICCGRFKLKKGSSEVDVYTNTSFFSHQLKAEDAGRKNEYKILPRKGEVWALYKNWTAEIKLSDLGSCEYDVVEVLDESDSWIKVIILERVNGFSSVFKAQLKGRTYVTVEIPRVELLRFSHQIPSFRLTEERGGSLRGFWELDAAALPLGYFS